MNYDFLSPTVRKARKVYRFFKRDASNLGPWAIGSAGDILHAHRAGQITAAQARARVSGRKRSGKVTPEHAAAAHAIIAAASVKKRLFSTAERKKDAADGSAMAGGGYPIKAPVDVHNAYMDWIRTGRSSAVKAHIESRAKALGVSSPFQKSLLVEVDFTKSLPVDVPDLAKGLVWGWASVIEKNGEPVTDFQGDRISEDELMAAAHDYMESSRVSGAMHCYDPATDEPLEAGTTVESLVFTKALQKALNIDLGRVGWFIGQKINSPLVRKAVASGKLRSFSIGGRGVRVPAED